MKISKFILACIAVSIITLLSGGKISAQNRNEGTSKPHKYVTELTDETFNTLVFNTDKGSTNYLGKLPAIVDFYADWCGPCVRTAPILEDIAKEYSGKIVVYKVDVDKCGKIANAMGISSIPAILYIPTDSRPVMTVGARGKEQFKTEISKYLLK